MYVFTALKRSQSLESDTLLRTEDQLLTEVMRELGFQKRGKRIVEAITSAIGRGLKTA